MLSQPRFLLAINHVAPESIRLDSLPDQFEQSNLGRRLRHDALHDRRRGLAQVRLGLDERINGAGDLRRVDQTGIIQQVIGEGQRGVVDQAAVKCPVWVGLRPAPEGRNLG